jgi:hypothetical protein
MGKLDWFAVAMVVIGMLPVVVVAIMLFSR